MLKPRQWNIEYLLQMLSGLMFCLATGMLLQLAVMSEGMADTGSGRVVAQIIHVIFFNLGGFLCVAWMLKREGIGWSEGFGLNKNMVSSAMLGGGVTLIVAPIVMGFQGVMARLLTPKNETPQVQEVVRVIEQTVQMDHLVFYGFMAIVMAPVIEELLFRGVFYPTIKSRGYPRVALWGTSVMFALVHYNLLTFLPLTLLALILAWLYERTGNLLAPIMAHSCFNTINFVLLVFREEIHGYLQSVE